MNLDLCVRWMRKSDLQSDLYIATLWLLRQSLDFVLESSSIIILVHLS